MVVNSTLNSYALYINKSKSRIIAKVPLKKYKKAEIKLHSCPTNKKRALFNVCFCVLKHLNFSPYVAKLLLR